MKKFLSMVMALVMVMSLVTISAGAKDFTDNDVITYDEAVAVVSEVGIVDGYADGEFKPANTLTRQAAAKIICNLILGPTTAAELHADTAPYRDVPANGEFAGYIAYCQSKGIISGYADGAFRPGNTLTGYAFMKMLLGALGYDATLESYVGSNWSINVAKQAIGIGLNKGLEGEFNGIKAVTREEACLYAFNTLQADLVEYSQRLTTTINGTEVTLSSGGAHAKEWSTQQTRVNNIREDDIIQFAEEYFNKLEKKADTDEFMRPSYTWLYDKEEIGTYVNWELLVEEYTSGVTGRDLYDLLGATTLRDSDMTYYVDGLEPDEFTSVNNFAITDIGDCKQSDIVRSNTDDFGVSANGVLTQVFLEKGIGRDERNELTIVSIDTWLGRATGDYQENKEYAPIDVYYGWTPGTKTTVKAGWNVDVEDVPSVVDVQDEDYFLVNISFKENNKGDVVSLTDPEVLDKTTITKFSKSDKKVIDKLTTNGTEYKSARMAFYSDDALDEYNATLLPDHTYNVFMDPYGYVIAVELDDGAKNYVFITGFDRPTSNLSISTADAAAIFLDGTMDTIKVNVTETNKNIDRIKDEDTGEEYFVKWTNEHFPGDEGCYRLNRWFTYSTNKSGVYTLTPATRMTATKYGMADATDDKVTIKTANVSLKDNVLTTTNYPYSPVAGTVGTWDVTMAAPFNAKYTKSNNVRAYGNDDSVFITVGLDDVDTDDGTRAITEVNDVFSGVQDVELEIDVTSAIEEAQIYTVYDRNGYIIGAVTTGEAKGGNATIAYVLSDVKSERYDSAEDAHYWEFDAFVNGEKKTLTVKDKYGTLQGAVDTEYAKNTHNSGIGTNGVTDYNRYDGIVELRFDADENVVDIKNVVEKDIYNYYLGGKSIQDNTATGIDGYTKMNLDDAKVYRMNVLNSIYTKGLTWAFGGVTHNYDSAPDTVMLRGRTMYVTADRHDEGLALTSDAKALVIQKENGSWEKTEYNTVASAISGLADADETTDGLQYSGEIVAAINGSGAGTWVVFINYTELVTGSRPVPGSGRLTAIDVAGDGFWNDDTPARAYGDTYRNLGYSNPGYDYSARYYAAAPTGTYGTGKLTYQLVGSASGQTYKMVLEVLGANGWIVYDEWNVKATTANYIDRHYVGVLNPASQWRLTCGNVVAAVSIVH